MRNFYKVICFVFFFSTILVIKPIAIRLDYENMDINDSTTLSTVRDYNLNSKNYYSSNQLISYYANLKGNIGYNLKGTCGYIAMAMLLSYYDTYVNDNIIPESFDAISSNVATVSIASRTDSPGIFREAIDSSYNNCSNATYNGLVDTYATVSLHSKLIQMGNYNYGTNYLMRYNIIQNYISTYSISSICSVEGVNNANNSSSQIRNYVIQKIQNGQPVLVGMSNSTGENNHAFIAYGYDSTSDKIICNYGWGYNYAYQYIEDGISSTGVTYTNYKSALVLNVNTHNHSNNYRFNSILNSMFYHQCGCGNIIDHTHNYSFQYKYLSKSKHRCYCECGNSILEVHLPFGKCICGYDSTILKVVKEEDYEED